MIAIIRKHSLGDIVGVYEVLEGGGEKWANHDPCPQEIYKGSQRLWRWISLISSLMNN